MKTVIAAAVALAALAAPVLAQDARPDRPAKAPVARAEMEAKLRARLAKVDANRDGLLAREEMRAAGEARRAEGRAKAFDRLDANRDGTISRDEFNAPRAKGDKRGGAMGRALAMRGMAGAGGMAALADKDGRIAIDAVVKAALARFDAADMNRDGTLTPEERRAAREARRANRG